MLCLDGRSRSVPGACPLRRGDRATCGAMPYNTRGGLPGGTRFLLSWVSTCVARDAARHGSKGDATWSAIDYEP